MIFKMLYVSVCDIRKKCFPGKRRFCSFKHLELYKIEQFFWLGDKGGGSMGLQERPIAEAPKD